MYKEKEKEKSQNKYWILHPPHNVTRERVQKKQISIMYYKQQNVGGGGVDSF